MLVVGGRSTFGSIMKAFLVSWVERHRHPVNLWLHVAGIPVAFGGPVVALVNGAAGWALAALAAGYALQFVGHAVEGNDAGELILVKKLLGLPYRAVAAKPRTPPPRKASRDRSRRRVPG
jgi:hypothetical protein